MSLQISTARASCSHPSVPGLVALSPGAGNHQLRGELPHAGHCVTQFSLPASRVVERLATTAGSPKLQAGEEDGAAEVTETLRKQCEEGELSLAVGALDAQLEKGCHVDNSLLYRVLKRCTAKKDLILGRRVHDLVLKGRYHTDAFLANHLIRMYASHGMLEEATQVFRKVPAPDCYVWSSIISAHAEHGQSSQAIHLYRELRRSALKLNSYVFVAALKACATAKDVAAGKEVHADTLDILSTDLVKRHSHFTLVCSRMASRQPIM